MSIEAMLRDTCKQTAVYWGSPVPNGYGGYTFAQPVEILCRWVEKSELYMDNNGVQRVSKSVIHVLQDVDEEGYLYLGELSVLGSDPIPSTTNGAFMIKKFSKVPDIEGVEFVRKAYL